MIFFRSHKNTTVLTWRAGRKSKPISKAAILTNRKLAQAIPKKVISESAEVVKGFDMKSFYDLTKFKLSQYNTLASYSMYLYYSPVFNPYESLVFLWATQLITMSSQAYNQVVEGEYDK